jgi:PKD repeat protein
MRWLILGILLLGFVGGLGAEAQQGGPLRVQFSLDPTQINVRGTGSPELATVTIALSGPEISGPPMDLLLALDRSASVELDQVREIAREFVEHLSGEDRVGIVSFADTAKLELELTSDKAKALETIDALTEGTQTAIGDGLMLGLDELVEHGRSEAFRLIVLPTDGVSNAGRDPMPQAVRAAEEKIPVYPIAISPAARRQLLSELARTTAGMYFARFSEDVLESVFRQADRAAVARFIRITQTLPDGVGFEGATEHPPAVNRGRHVIQLEWQIPVIFEGDVWQTRYQISVSQDGTFELAGEPSQISYTDPQGQMIVLAFPSGTTLQGGRGSGGPSQPPEEGGGQPPSGQQPPQPAGSNKPPTAALVFSPEEPVTGDAVRFDASGSSDPDGTIAEYGWDWDNDGEIDETSQEPEALRVFTDPGAFTVRVVVKDDQGATAEATVSVKVKPGLRAAAAVSAEGFQGDPAVPEWMSYYIDDGVVTDEEVRDANARFAADVFIPGTQYRLTSDDVQALIQINELARIVSRYTDPQAAEADGYVKVGDPISEVGQAYVKEDFLSDPPQYDRPPVLLYADDGGGKLTLAGVRFVSAEQEAMLFQVTDWPSRPAAAHFADGSEQSTDSPDKAPAQNAQGSRLIYWHPELYGLTVWVGTVNPNGLFASRNPKVK